MSIAEVIEDDGEREPLPIRVRLASLRDYEEMCALFDELVVDEVEISGRQLELAQLLGGAPAVDVLGLVAHVRRDDGPRRLRRSRASTSLCPRRTRCSGPT